MAEPTTDSPFRAEVIGAIKPLLPATWDIYPDARTTDSIPAGHVQLSLVLKQIAKMPAAPLGALQITYTIVIVVPDDVEADDAIDDALLDLLVAMRTEPTGLLSWQQATRAETKDGKAAYNVDITFTRSFPTTPME